MVVMETVVVVAGLSANKWWGTDCGLGTEHERASAMMLSFPATQVMEKL